MNPRPLCLIPVLCLALGGGAAAAQTPVPITDPDPKQFMRAAAAATSLIEPDMKPWHLRARYQQFNPDGAVKHEGAFEAWWAGPEQNKISYTGAEFTRTEYRVGADTWFTGASNPPPSLENVVKNLLLHPLPSEERLAAMEFTQRDEPLAGATFRCLTETEKILVRSSTTGALTAAYQAYCFQGPLPAVRMILGISEAVETFNGIVRLHDRYLAKQVRFQTQGRPWIAIDVDVVDPELGVETAALTPPANATVAAHILNVSSGVIAGSRTAGVAPKYPAEAVPLRVEGRVILAATIGKTGKIENLQVLTGPAVLQQAALDAVKTWRYKPFILNNEPVEVHTQINVDFRFGPGQ